MKHVTKTVLTLLLILSTVFSLVSCRRISASDLSEGYERKVDAGKEISEEAGSVISNFGLSVFRNVAVKGSGNQLFSPLSAIVCLALMANGTDGETLAQIEGMLGCDIDTLNEALLTYSSSIVYKDSPVRLANSIWIKDTGSFKVNADFLQKNADYFGAQIYSAPFDTTTLNDINQWCDEHTDGMIKKILDRIDPSALTYMMNALTFDAEWAVKYEKKDVIESYDFNSYSGSVSSVSALRSQEHVYLEDENAVGFIKNYKGNKFSFAALLPNEGVDVYDYISSLNAEKWSELWSGKVGTSVNVILPEFKYEKEFDLTKIMESLGVTDMFSPDRADFSRLGTYDGGNIYCGLFKQKTFIQVDRNGTKAAAVTIGSNKGMAAEPLEPKAVYLDRPFVYAIVDNETGLPIFIGCVAELN